MKTAFLFLLLLPSVSLAKTVHYELSVRNEPVNMSGKETVDFALTVNGGIPGPTLEFTEGDEAEIVLKNDIKPSGGGEHSHHQDVSVHWHGILLPPLEDGVPYTNTPPIFPGQSRTFRFTVRQNGTYWYHSHTMNQEQKGVYGSIVIHPKKETIKADKDAVVVLSDWSDENADQILRNLKKDGEYYMYKKGTMRSYFDAIKEGKLMNQFKNEWTRMGGMDLSDVGYDAFLINGKQESQLVSAKPGEKVRVRLINASASTYFKVSLGKLPMKVISADGHDIEPIEAKEIFFGMAETYDVLFTVPAQKNYELRATSQDGTGKASTFIGSGEKVFADDVPKPDLYETMDHSMMGMDMSGMSGMDHSNMKGMDHSNMKGMDHSKMDMSGMSDMKGMDHSNMKMDHSQMAEMDHSKMNMDHSQMKGMDHEMAGMDHSKMHDSSDEDSDESKADATPMSLSSGRSMKTLGKTDQPATKQVDSLTVDDLKALTPYSIPANVKVHELKLVLNGDMRRYVWYINGKTISEDRLIIVNPGEVVRITYVNESMMNHPMHLHGHFFRVVNDNGSYSPWKHTVDVPPMGTRTIELFADEVGQWMLHCHMMYHMNSGMARMVRYSNFAMTPEMIALDAQDHHLQDPWYTYGKAEVSSNHAQGQFRVSQSWNEFDARIEGANIKGKNFDYNFGEQWDYEADLFYRRWLDNWTNLIVGATSYGERVHGVVGVGYFLPMMIETNLLVNHEGQFRLDVERKFQWTKTVYSDVDFTWRPGNQHGDRETDFEVSLMYSPKWSWAAGLMLTNYSLGAGLEYQF